MLIAKDIERMIIKIGPNSTKSIEVVMAKTVIDKTIRPVTAAACITILGSVLAATLATMYDSQSVKRSIKR